jgi:5-formyltetrahydrofolate cyclo-ligase
MMSFAEEKSSLRKKLILERQNLSQNDRQKWDEQIFKNLVASKAIQKASSISCFVGSQLKSEIDTLPILQYFLEQNFLVSVPVMLDKTNIKMAQIQGMDDLEPNNWGILEPRDKQFVSVEPDICVVPLLAADQQKHRVGYGAGYYDRYLSSLSNSITIGIVYQCFIFEKLPSEIHDIPLNIIVTDQTVLN